MPKLAQGAILTLELVAIAVIAGLLLAIPLGIAFFAPVVRQRPALRLHLLLPGHAVAGAVVPGLLRPGAVRCGA